MGREDPRPRRAAARLAGGRDRRLRVLGRRLRAVRRPRRRGAPDPAVGAGLGRPPRIRRGRAGVQARAGAGYVRAGGRAARPDARARATAEHRRARPRPVRPARVPDLHRGRPRDRRRRGPPRDRRGRPAAGGARSAAAGAAGSGGVRHALSADVAGDHGQGGRGHRLLPLLPAARAVRCWRRPRPFRDLQLPAFTRTASSERGGSH